MEPNNNPILCEHKINIIIKIVEFDAGIVVWEYEYRSLDYVHGDCNCNDIHDSGVNTALREAADIGQKTV